MDQITGEKKEMNEIEKSRKLLLIGIFGCLLFVIGDFLFAATGREQTTESFGFMVRKAYLEMGTWRMVLSILCGFFGTMISNKPSLWAALIRDESIGFVKFTFLEMIWEEEWE